MYSKTGILLDRRELLKIKIKALAAEARIIRQAERKTRGDLREEMHLHRIGVVREATRNALIAYGLIRGRTIDQMEPTRRTDPDWEAVNRMVMKYGPLDSNDKVKLIHQRAA